MQTLVIEPKPEPTDQPFTLRRRRAPKSRAFSATKLAHVSANMLWEGGQAETPNVRPIWIALGGTETELKPFVANFYKLGRPAEVVGSARAYSRDRPDRIELLRSGNYSATWQKVPSVSGGLPSTVVTIAKTDLLILDPGMVDHDRCTFVCLPPVWWVEAQRAALRADHNRCAAIVAHGERLGFCRADGPLLPPGVAFTPEALLDLAPLAAYVMAYIDRRTTRPLLTDLDFAVQLYLAALRDGILSLSATSRSISHNDGHRARPATEAGDPWLWARHRWANLFQERDTGAVGLMPGVVAHTTHSALDALLSTEVRRYVEYSHRLSALVRAA